MRLHIAEPVSCSCSRWSDFIGSLNRFNRNRYDTALAVLRVIDEHCQQIFDLITEAVTDTSLAEVVREFAGSSNPYITRTLSFKLAQFELPAQEHLLVFELLRQLNTQDEHTLNNLITALRRLDQKTLDWRTGDHQRLVNRLLERCARYGETLREYAADGGRAHRLAED